MSNNKRDWDALPMSVKSELMKIYRKGGVYTLSDMKNHYNSMSDMTDDSASGGGLSLSSLLLYNATSPEKNLVTEKDKEAYRKRLAKEQAEIDATLKPQQDAYAKEVALRQQSEEEQRKEAELYEKRVKLLEKIDAFREQGYDVTERYDDFGNIVGFTRSKEPKKQTKSTYKPTTYKASSDNIFKYPNNSNVHSDATGYNNVETLDDGTLRWLSNDEIDGKRVTYHTDPNYRLLDYSFANGGPLDTWYLPNIYAGGGANCTYRRR